MAGNFTNYAENKILDWLFRGQSISWPTNWYVALGSAADDGSFSELSYTSYARTAIARSLANFAGTQGAGTTIASSGTSHQTSNNTDWNMATPGASSGTPAQYVGLFDASSSGNCWMWFRINDPDGNASPITITSGVAIAFAAGSVTFTLGLTGGMTDYLANVLIDLIFRGQSYTPPSDWHAAQFVSAPSNAGGGVEVGGGVGYARQAIASSLSAWGATSSPGSTSASSGTDGRISNNNDIAWDEPTGDWNTLTSFGLFDSPSAGNLGWWGSYAVAQTIAAGATPPAFAADALGISLD